MNSKPWQQLQQSLQIRGCVLLALHSGQLIIHCASCLQPATTSTSYKNLAGVGCDKLDPAQLHMQPEKLLEAVLTNQTLNMSRKARLWNLQAAGCLRLRKQPLRDLPHRHHAHRVGH